MKPLNLDFKKPLYLLMVGLFMLLAIADLMAQDEFQLPMIEQELMFQLEAYREARDLPLLDRSEYLDAVAFDQAEYVAEKGRIVHEQDKDNKKTLQDRLLYYEALNAEAGENLALISPNSKAQLEAGGDRLEISNEELLVKAAIFSWLDDEASALNLNDPNFYEMGIAVHETERNEFVLLVIFASKPYEIYKGVKQKFNFRGVGSYKKEECKEFDENFATAPELFSDAFKVEDGMLYFEYHNKAIVENILSSGSHAISAEVLVDEQFDCSESNRLFPGEITDGYLMPLLKKGALTNLNQTADESSQPKNGVKLLIGEIPNALLNSSYEINGIFIQNGHKCATVPYNQIEVENLQWLDLPLKLLEQKSDSLFWEDSLKFTFSIYGTHTEKLQEITQLIDKLGFKIKAVKLTQLQSPISTVSQPDALISKIAEQLKISDLIASSELKKQRQFKAYKDFEANTIYQLETKGLDSLSRLTYLRETAKEDDKLASFLNSLDELKLELIGTVNLDRELEPADRLYLFHFAREQGRTDLAIHLLNRMIADQDNSVKSLFSERENLDQDKNDLPLINNLMVAAVREGEKSFDGNTIVTAFLEIHLIYPSQKIIRYNYLLAQLRSWAEGKSKMNNPDQWEDSFEKLRSSIDPIDYARGKLNFNMILADYYYDLNKPKEREDAIEEVMKWAVAAKLPSDKQYALARYLAFQDQFSRAILAMKPLIEKDNAELEHLFYFLQLSIYDKELVSNESYYQYLDKTAKLYPDQFCQLFSKEKMGLQLLKDYEIKERYCSRCAD